MFLLGNPPGVADSAANHLQARYPNLIVSGTSHGYFNKKPGYPQNEAVLQQIYQNRPNLLLVGFGMPTQERWLAENWSQLEVNVAITCGALFEYLAGDLRRGPSWMTENYLEWLARVIISPRRYGWRYLRDNPLFFYRILKQKYRQGQRDLYEKPDLFCGKSRGFTNMTDDTVDLIYIDPPFNTGKSQKRTQIRTQRSETGDRTGFSGRRYQTVKIGSREYQDIFDDYLEFLEPRIEEAYRILAAHGTLYFHIDYREVHYCKILLDQIFGRESFLNEIIWAYDYGGRSKKKWPAKHDNILVYVKDPRQYIFNASDIDRIPYMAPTLVGPEKAARGKLPTDTWWHTIVATNSKEKTGYPTQKPLGVIDRIIRASSNPGDLVLDFFAGSGTTGISCLGLGRKFILVDNNPQAIQVMQRRFSNNPDIDWIGIDSD